MTQVLDMKRGCMIAYALEPARALVAANEQYVKRNWNTWTYPDPVTQDIQCVDLGNGVSVLSLGDYSTICPTIMARRGPVPQDYELKVKP